MAGSCGKEEEDEEWHALLQECNLLGRGCEIWDRRSDSEDDLDLGSDGSASRSSSEGDLVLGASGNIAESAIDSTIGSDAEPHLELVAEAPLPKAANGWMPGWSCGPELTRLHNWHTQAFVLVANVYLALQRVPRDVLQALTSAMDSGGRGPSLALKGASGLLRLSATSVWRAVTRTRKNNWQPAESHHQQRAAEDDSLDSGALLRRLTRVALGVRDSHGTSVDYQKWLARLETEGVPIGDKYHSRHHPYILWMAEWCHPDLIWLYPIDSQIRIVMGIGLSSSWHPGSWFEQPRYASMCQDVFAYVGIC